MTRGKFITLEGGEGLGKSTNLPFIRDWLEQREIPTIATREPGGTPIGEQIRAILLNGEGLADATELLLVFAARAQHLQQVVEPALAAGRWVVCDRFVDASHAYQGGGRGLPAAFIDALETHVLRGLKPDLTFLFDAPVELGLARAGRRGPSDRFESETLAFFERVQTSYRRRAVADPARFRLIDASGELSDVQDQLRLQLEEFIPR